MWREPLFCTLSTEREPSPLRSLEPSLLLTGLKGGSDILLTRLGNPLLGYPFCCALTRKHPQPRLDNRTPQFDRGGKRSSTMCHRVFYQSYSSQKRELVQIGGALPSIKAEVTSRKNTALAVTAGPPWRA